MTHRPRHAGKGPSRSQQRISKPSPAPPGERGGGGYTAPSKPKPFVTKPSAPPGEKGGGGYVAPPKKTKKVIVDTSEDTGREKGIKKYATTGLKELGRHRKQKVFSIMQNLNLSTDEKKKAIQTQNLTGAFESHRKKLPQYSERDILRGTKYIGGTKNISLYNPERHKVFNAEMSNVIRNYSERFGLDRYDPFVNDIYSQLGAKQFALQYNAAFGSGREVTGIGNILGLVASPIYQFGSELAKSSPNEYFAKAASDTLLNWKGIFSTSSEETKAYKADPNEFEQQLIEDSIMKIRDEANRRKTEKFNISKTGLMGQQWL